MVYKNTTQRIGDKFIDCLDKINSIREDKLSLKKLSMVEFTNLIIKHSAFKEIIDDTIPFTIRRKNGK